MNNNSWPNKDHASRAKSYKCRNKNTRVSISIHVNNRPVLSVDLFDGRLKGKRRYLFHDKGIVANNIINTNRIKNKVANLRKAGTKFEVVLDTHWSTGTYWGNQVGKEIDNIIERWEERNKIQLCR